MLRYDILTQLNLQEIPVANILLDILPTEKSVTSAKRDLRIKLKTKKACNAAYNHN